MFYSKDGKKLKLMGFCCCFCPGSCILQSRSCPTVWNGHLQQGSQRKHGQLRPHGDVSLQCPVRSCRQPGCRVHRQRYLDQDTRVSR